MGVKDESFQGKYRILGFSQKLNIKTNFYPKSLRTYRDGDMAIWGLFEGIHRFP